MSEGTPSANPVQATSAKSKKNKKKNKKSAAQSVAPDASKGNEASPNGESRDPDSDGSDQDEAPESTGDVAGQSSQSNGTNQTREETMEMQATDAHPSADSLSTDARLAAAAKERDDLRAQVTALRQSLEEIQDKHEQELSKTKSELDESRIGKEHAETRYQKLLGQVNTIKTQLGERLKSDAAELSQARDQIEELEEQNKSAAQKSESLQSQITKLEDEKEQQSQELSSLRGRTNLSQQNWAKERDDMVQREAQLREEFEAAKQAMQDWEVLAMEERSAREGLSDRVGELEEQLSSQQQAYDRAISDRDTQSSTVDGLQRALQEVHEARKQERRELVENSQAQIDELKKSLKDAEETSSTAQTELETTKHELQRTLPFEKEVKEKNLLIGKLRHEAVILNDHLTKALRFLKRGKPEDNVDRQLVTNHFLQFLSLDRSDPKKFQILLLIAALLGWSEEQKESAGLARPGASTGTNLRVPLSAPFRRVSSTATLNPLSSNSVTSPTLPSPSMASFNSGLDSPSGKESLAELWSDFLEREAEQGSKGSQSRRSSTASRPGLMSPPLTGSPFSRKSSQQAIAEEEGGSVAK